LSSSSERLGKPPPITELNNYCGCASHPSLDDFRADTILRVILKDYYDCPSVSVEYFKKLQKNKGTYWCLCFFGL